MLDPDSEGTSDNTTSPSADFITPSQMNMGIACVVPAEHIAEVLELPEFVEHRQKLEKEIKATQAQLLAKMDLSVDATSGD